MVSPELLARLTALVSSGAESVGASKAAVLSEVLDRAIALVDREAGVKYLAAPEPVFEPVTLTWPLGSTATITRDGNIVTAVVTVADELETAYIPLSDEFGPQGAVLVQIIDRVMQLSISELSEFGQLGIAVTATGLEPITGPGTFQWIADPVTGTGPLERVSTVPDVVLDGAYVELAAELYTRRDAPNGITQFAAADGSAMRVRMDPLDAVRAQLRPYLAGGFA